MTWTKQVILFCLSLLSSTLVLNMIGYQTI
ncbi:hypothetical protein HNR31_002369 [Anoxybacillus caldiproteolyticus]|uniref:Uncharacterized protein n=1 Tax=Thermaerobacillus caldiproteolyticus TaxID=247480 RepID=A0A7V9Z7V6_9BACL|nr:hypothetical protein [Anoxybacillus caldiproteolyticus]